MKLLGHWRLLVILVATTNVLSMPQNAATRYPEENTPHKHTNIHNVTLNMRALINQNIINKTVSSVNSIVKQIQSEDLKNNYIRIQSITENKTLPNAAINDTMFQSALNYSVVSTRSISGTSKAQHFKINVKPTGNDNKIIMSFVNSTLEDLRLPNTTVSKVGSINSVLYGTLPNMTSTNSFKIARNTSLYKVGTVGAGAKLKKVPTTQRPRTSTKRNKTKTKKKPNDQLKQTDFVLVHIPSPDPMPEVTSYSPQYNVLGSVRPNSNEVINNIVPLSAVETSSNGYPSVEDDDDSIPLNIPLGQFNFDMIPDDTSIGGVRCPEFHLSSNAFGPQMKQACPDINIVLNSHYQQNMVPDRAPIAEGNAPVPTLQAAPVEAAGGLADQAEVVPAAADAAPAAAAPAAAAPAAPVSTGGGTGGIAGLPPLGFPNLPGLPDLKGVFDLLGGIGGLLGGAWNLLVRFAKWIFPILIAIPVAVFFKSLAVAFFAFFPIWVPALWWAVQPKKKKSEVAYYKHVHKPVYHPDGWFWNHNTKTWTNLDEYTHSRNHIVQRKRFSVPYRMHRRLESIPASIEKFAVKYQMRQNPPIGDTIKQVTNQLIDLNTTSQLTFDTRTPPKIQQMVKEKIEMREDFNPGIAEPIDEDALILEESTKKMNFYKSDKSTTDSGLSTWILLSGQGMTTNKPIKKTIMKNLSTTFIPEDANKIIKPIFKRKQSVATTTKKPTTAINVTDATIPISTTTIQPEKTTKLTKVKASLLTNAMQKNTTQQGVKKVTTPKAAAFTNTTPKPIKTTTTEKPAKKMTEAISKKNVELVKKTTEPPTKKVTEFVKITTKAPTINETIESNSVLGPEAKDGAIELPSSNSKKTRKPVTTTAATVKRKKNKTKRKKPSADDKSDNSTHLKTSHKHKEKPIGTQIYNYLSREVMPTVGVGLVGLMVTAGLASYFLYPFSPVRRSYEVDRKDKVAPYYYKDEYSGGIAEEEAIGKVIAGMPTHSYNTRQQNSRNTFPNRYRHVDQRYMQGSVETVQINPHAAYKIEEVIVGSPKKEEFTGMDKKFVVGNVPKQIQESSSASPAVVPEHGPRNIQKEEVFVVHSVPATEPPSENMYKVDHGPRRIRRRRQAMHENEIDNNILPEETYSTSVYTTTPTTTKPITTTTKNPIIEKTESILELIKDLFYYKLRLGLQLLQNKTESLSRYFKRVQDRIDDNYRESNRDNM